MNTHRIFRIQLVRKEKSTNLTNKLEHRKAEQSVKRKLMLLKVTKTTKL